MVESSESYSITSALALVLLVPEEKGSETLLRKINELRDRHDKAAARWPPHITLIPSTQLPISQVTDAELASAIKPAAASLDPIEFCLDTISVFSHKGGSSTIVLEPSSGSDAIKHLHSQLVSSMPHKMNPDKHSYRPHLTLATLKAGDPSELAARILRDLEAMDGFPLKATAEHVSVMSKLQGKDERYRCFKQVPLCKGLLPSEGVRQVFPEDQTPISTSDVPKPLSPYAFNLSSQQWEALPQAAAMEPSDDSMTLLTYNVLSDASHPSNYSEEARFRNLVDVLEFTNANVIALQEVNETFLRLLIELPCIQSTYYLSAVHYSEVPTGLLCLAKKNFTFKKVQLSFGKTAIIVNMGPELTIGIVHLTSSYHADKTSLRISQWKTLQRHLNPESIVLGDFNIEAGNWLERIVMDAGFSDAWKLQNPEDPGLTFDPTRNQLAMETSRNGIAARYDRIFVRSNIWIIQDCRMIGENEVEDLSDHFGILSTFVHSSITDEFDRSVQTYSTISHRTFEEVEADCLTDEHMAAILSKYAAIPTRKSFENRSKALEAVQAMLSQCFKPAPFHIAPVGSFVLGTDAPDSDIDILCLSLISQQEFFGILNGNEHEFPIPDGCQILRLVADAKVPVVELLVHGVKVDIQYGTLAIPLSQRFDLDQTLLGIHVLPSQLRQLFCGYLDIKCILQAVPTNMLSAFRLASRFLKLWAKRKGLHTAKLGFPPSHSVSVLLAHTCRAMEGQFVTASQLVARFFAEWSRHSWEDPVTWNQSTQSLARNTAMAVMTPSLNVNICRNVLACSRDAWISELKTVTLLGDSLEDILAEYLILENHQSFVHIEVSAPTSTQLQKLKLQVELKLMSLFIAIDRRCPSILARPWHEWFVVPENDPETSANFLIGLNKRTESILSADDKKLALATLDNVLVQFQTDLSRSESFSSGMWVNASHVARKAVQNLFKAPELAPIAAFAQMDNALPTLLHRMEVSESATLGSSQPGASKHKLRSSEDVFNRILWDTSFDPDNFVIGYMDRFVGMQEISFHDFAVRKADQQGDDWIPFHRVWYFKCVNGGDITVVWDRKAKTDSIFA
ncbi:hypothetical protein BC830DRAFT_1095054 [Chytriomyces sp. MP71]|nr:hypothetical protein BC830DRAFT_1095054 [Chytriomyces sp. MP71]